MGDIPASIWSTVAKDGAVTVIALYMVYRLANSIDKINDTMTQFRVSLENLTDHVKDAVGNGK